MECEDQETLMFHSYTGTAACAYYVQSPSTISHANSGADIRNTTTINIIDHESAFHSPSLSETTITKNNHNLEVARFTTLSRYSSSRGSNNSFLHDNKKVIIITDDDIHAAEAPQNRLIIVDHHGDEYEDDEWYYGSSSSSSKKGLWWRYFSFRRSNSCAWICLQISWRLLLSLGVALLVFYMASKPPPPNISIKKAGIGEFGLGEGVDSTGVATKMLTCNCSIHLIIDNKSKLFGLHVHPPIIEMSFGRLPFASSHGPKLYAASHDSSSFHLYVGTRNKPMYGAGRSMQDMLDSGKGLPLIIRMSLRSNFRVVWDLIKLKFHHQAECLLFLNDKKHQPQLYNSTCTITS